MVKSRVFGVAMRTNSPKSATLMKTGYCWIKGVPSFDTLRQACIDPERAFVGAQPPTGASPSQVIDHLEISNAAWAKTNRLTLTPG